MTKIKDSIRDSIRELSNRKNNISVKMTQYYIVLMLGWTAANLLASLITRIEKTSMYYFAVLTVGMILFICLGRLVNGERFFVELFNLGLVCVTPITWYVCGGSASSTVNSLYLLGIIYFCLCSYGARRIIGSVILLMEVAACNVISGRIPKLSRPEYATAGYVQMMNTFLGFTTTIVIVLLLFKQIREYNKEKALSEAYEADLKRSNELQKMFLANMSHEIRSPLGIVLGFNELISHSNNIDDIKEYSHNIASSGETLKVVINDILDYSKIESGKLEIIEGDYSLKKMLDEIKRNIKLKASEKGLIFDIEVAGDVPDMLYGDDVRIRQCLINVLSNAVKYTETGEVLLRVTKESTPDDSDGCCLKFLCHDTGKGINPEAIPYLFSAFERINESHNRGIEGTGLGLAITKSLVDEMNGTITVDSTVGAGSDFVITLSQKLSDKEAERRADVHEYSLKNIKIAVVDDTKPNLILCRKILEMYGADVSTYDNGVAFLDACSKIKFNVLLIDHMMPVMDGVEVLKRLKEKFGPNLDTPCLAFTANAMAGVEKEYMDMGFDGFISKPVNRDSMVSKICLLTGSMIK